MNKTPILVLCDDMWHPAEVVERGLASLPQQKYQFDVVKTAKDILTPELLHRYPAVICCKSNCINLGNHEPWFEEGVTEVMPDEFKNYVAQGHGFVSLHSGAGVRAEEPSGFRRPHRLCVSRASAALRGGVSCDG